MNVYVHGDSFPRASRKIKRARGGIGRRPDLFLLDFPALFLKIKIQLSPIVLTGSSESLSRTTGCRVGDSWLNLKAIVLAAFLRQGYSTTSPHPQVHTRVHWDIISTSMRTGK
jgi:hypothetical protein